jgi:prepilin-type N-terminal cleavage/methylation domain-containing protein
MKLTTAMPLNRTPARRRGFTLVEVLATLALLGILLPAITSGFSLCMATADQARRQAQAASLAHGKLCELVASGQLDRAVLTGDFGADWPDYRWTATVSNWESDLLSQLDVKVLWRHGSADREVTVTTLVYTGGTQ